MKCPYIMIQQLQSFLTLDFIDNPTFTVSRIYYMQATVAVALLITLGIVNDIYWKIILSITIVYMQVWMILNAVMYNTKSRKLH
jgi:hypothetical protein